MSFIDLHTHSNASDGALSPSELVLMALKSGLSAIAIADHDTLEGQPEALAAGEELGIRVIPAIELSVDNEDGSLHLLAYGIDHDNSDLEQALVTLRESRMERNGKIIERLNEMGYSINLKDVLELSPTGTVGRAHIGQALVNSGQMPSMSEAFDQLLTRGGPAYFDRYRLKLWDAVPLIHTAGGAAVWAHPGLHGEERLDVLLTRLPKWKEYGLDGIESDYRDHSIELRDRLRSMAKIHGLIYTGGSDFHGSIKPENRLGEGAAGRPIDISRLEALDEVIALNKLKYLTK